MWARKSCSSLFESASSLIYDLNLTKKFLTVSLLSSSLASQDQDCSLETIMVNPSLGVYSVRREHLRWSNRNPWGSVSFGRSRPSSSVNVILERYCDKRFVASFSYTPLLSSMIFPKNQNVLHISFYISGNT